jgi:aspartate racemase
MKTIGLIGGIAQEGAEGFILGCTEIPLLIKQEHSALPAFDTTFLHSQAAVRFALSK